MKTITIDGVEYNLLPKVKFKLGDWIVRGEGFVYEPSLITEIRDYYICELLNGERVTYTLNDVHKNFHLWTIADAKEGDVLAINWHEDNDSWEKIIIFKNYHAKGVKGLTKGPCVEGYGNTFKNGKLAINEEVPYYSKTWTHNLQPATKEQRDLLFQKMKENGCEWDADKKELKKIQPHYDISNFKPFDKVLVRCSNDEEWMIEFYCKYDTLVHTSPHRDYPFMGIGDSYSQCIPFEGNEHLLGTTDMCDEQYVNW